jgi:hypothetical protein
MTELIAALAAAIMRLHEQLDELEAAIRLLAEVRGVGLKS